MTGQHSGTVTDVPRTVAIVVGSPDEPLTEEQYRRQVGKRVRLVRVDVERSQDEIALRAGLSRNFVSAIERGAQGLDAWRLRRLAGALGVPAAWLLGLTDDACRPDLRYQERP
jgi:DNA-binding XRE family transcriptional regulator